MPISKKRLARLALALVVLLMACSALVLRPAKPAKADPVNDYPNNLATAAQDSLTDPWGFFNRECTSFVAWRLNNNNGIPFQNWNYKVKGTHFGNAYSWGSVASSIGITVDNTPEVGAVAWWYWPATKTQPVSGHVAWVAAINSDGSIQVQDYNWNYDGKFLDHKITSAPTGYIHFPGSGSSPSPTPATPPRIYMGTQLGPGQSMPINSYLAVNGYVLWFDTTGELALYAPGSVKLWWAGTANKGGIKLTMMSNDDLVMTNSSGGIVWDTGTGWGSNTCTNCAQLIVTASGAVAIQAQIPTEPLFWSTNWNLTPQPSFVGSEIGPGQSLQPGQYLMANNYRLAFQYDGNIILWGQAGEILWTPYTAGQAGIRLTMQSDDNAVLYRTDNSVVWASGTNGDSSICTNCALLTVMSDGVLIIFGQIPSEPTFWSTNWSPSATPAHTNIGTTIPSGQTMYLGQYIQTSGGELVLQLDGNLVFWNPNGSIAWTPYTAGSGADRISMLPSGLLVLYGSNNPNAWNSSTSSSCSCAQVDILPAGALVIDATSNGTTTYLWSTNWGVTPH